MFLLLIIKCFMQFVIFFYASPIFVANFIENWNMFQICSKFHWKLKTCVNKPNLFAICCWFPLTLCKLARSCTNVSLHVPTGCRTVAERLSNVSSDALSRQFAEWHVWVVSWHCQPIPLPCCAFDWFLTKTAQNNPGWLTLYVF